MARHNRRERREVHLSKQVRLDREKKYRFTPVDKVFNHQLRTKMRRITAA